MVDLSNAQAEALLLKFEEEMNKWEEREKVLSQEKLEIYKLRHLAKEICIHPSTQDKDDFDYHRREEWTVTTCTVCGKEVGRQ